MALEILQTSSNTRDYDWVAIEWRPAAHIYFEKVLSKLTLLAWGQGSESSKFLISWHSMVQL